MVSSRWIDRSRGIAVFAALLLSLSVLLMSSPAAAQGSEQARAMEHYQEGARHFFEEQYGRALVEFRQALRLSPHPMIMYNICLSFHRLDNHVEAYRHCVQAAEMEGFTTEESTRNDGRIAGIGAVLEAKAQADAAARAIARAEATAPSSGGLEPPEPVDGPGMSGLAWAGVGTAVVGGGLLAFAAVVNMQLAEKIQVYEATTDAALFDSLSEEIRQDTLMGQVGLYAGVGLVALGTTLFFVGRNQGRSDGLTVVPSVDPGGQAMLRLQGQF